MSRRAKQLVAALVMLAIAATIFVVWGMKGFAGLGLNSAAADDVVRPAAIISVDASPGAELVAEVVPVVEVSRPVRVVSQVKWRGADDGSAAVRVMPAVPGREIVLRAALYGVWFH